MKALKYSPSFFLVATLLALFFASTPQTEAALSNTLTWAGTTNTNVTASANWSAFPAYGGTNVFSLNSSIYQYVYTNTYSQLNGTQTFSYMGSNAAMYGVTFGGYSNVLVTNVGTFRLMDVGGINATNGTNSSGGRVTIWNTNTSQLFSSTILKGNMSVYLNNLYNHSSTARTVTNNLNDLAINNFGVNAANSATIGGVNGVNFTWEGTGTTTILGTIMVVNQTNTAGTATNNGALIVSSGTINIATTNGANASSTATNVDNSTVYGWNSGLVITNSGSVYVSGQNSLGMQAYNIKMGTTNGGTTTFGLFDTNSWATNSETAVTLTNNFEIRNATSAAATNIFKSVSGKTFTLSGVISSPANNAGTIVFQGTGGTNVLAGANTFSNAVVVSNTTLVLSNASALGATNAGTTVAGTSGRLDLNGQTISGEALTLSNSSAPSLLNSSATAASWSGAVTLGAATTISNTGDITLSGGISGSSSLTKLGAATLILSGSNSYTGTTTISNGVLSLSNTNALSGSTLSYSNAGTVSFGSLTGANVGGLQGSTNLALTNDSGTALALSVGGNNSNTTYSGILSGDGSLAKAGTGTLILSGLNTYGGTTTVGGGTLQVTNLANAGTSSAIGTNGTVILSNGGVLSYAGTTSTSMDRGINLAVGNGGLGVTNSAAALTVSGEITNTGNLVKSGAGTLILSASNSFTGTTTVSAGALVLGNTNALSGSTLAGAVSFGSLTGANIGGLQGSTNMGLTNASGTAVALRVGGNNSNTTYSGILSNAGSLTKVGSGTLTLSGANIFTGTTTISNGALVLGHTNALYYSTLDYSSAGTVSFGSLTGANIYVLQGSNNLALTNDSGAAVALQLGSNNTTTNTTYSGILSGSGRLIKSGTRTLTLGATNTYAGGTTINAGGVNISNGSSFGSGTVTIASNSTLRVLANNQNIANDIVISQANSTLAIGPSSTSGWVVTNSGVISGAGAVGSGANASGTVYLMNTNNSFGGGVFATNTGTMYANYIGNSGDNSSFGTNGTITIGNSSSDGGVRSINTNNETTDKVFSINSGSTYTASIFNVGTTNGATTLTLLSALNVTNANNKTINLGAYNGNALAMSGAVNDGDGGWTTTLLVGSVSTGTVFLNNTNNSFSGGVFVTNRTAGQTTTLQVNSFGNAGDTTSALGASNVVLTGTAGTAVLKYAGSGETTTRVITLTGVNNTLAIDASGTGALVMNSALNLGNNASHFVTLQGTNSGEITGNITNVATTNGTINKASVSTSRSNIALSSIVGLQVGQTVTGTGIAGSTTITAISADGDGSGTITLSANTTNVSTISAGAGTYAFLNTADSTPVTVTNQTALTKSGAGTWTLSGSNTYSGGTLLNAGTLALSNSYALGTGSLTFASNSTTLLAKANLNLSNNITLTANGTIDSGAFTLTNSGVISGAGSLTKAGAGTLLLSSSSNSYGGVTTISGGALQVTDLADAGIVSPIGTNGTIMLTNGGNFDYVGTANASMNRALNLAGGNGGIGVSSSLVAATFSGVISNTGNLVKSGAGTLILSASNSYTGATTVSAGTLELASLTGSAAGSASSLTVANGATLLLSQSDQVNDDATVTLSGGTIARGSGVSEVFGDLNLTVASFLDFGTGATGNMTFGTYTPGSLLTINNFTQVNMLVFGSDLTSSINDTSLFTFTNGAIGSSSWNGSTFTITAIPETSTYLAALGLLCLGALPLVRRKRAKIS